MGASVGPHGGGLVLIGFGLFVGFVVTVLWMVL